MTLKHISIAGSLLCEASLTHAAQPAATLACMANGVMRTESRSLVLRFCSSVFSSASVPSMPDQIFLHLNEYTARLRMTDGS
jgi:hypothetical protein